MDVQVVRSLSADDRLAVDEIATRLTDHLRLDLAHGPREGFTAVLGRHEGRLVAYAQASRGNEGFVVDAVVATGENDARLELLRALLAALPHSEPITWWTRESDTPLAVALGLVPGRRLLKMAVPLPLAEHTDLPTRHFVVGRDEQAWLEVNNAAFGWHGEQGGWDLATLRQREQEPWFRPEGFLLHERSEGRRLRLAGFCWTKSHEHAVGEIYVVAVHPDFHGFGLGRALTVAGLQSLHEHGAETGMLYVDADNTAAVALYRKLGFDVERVDQSYTTPHEGT